MTTTPPACKAARRYPRAGVQYGRTTLVPWSATVANDISRMAGKTMDQIGAGAMKAAAGPKIMAGAHGSSTSQMVAAHVSSNSQMDLVREIASPGATTPEASRIPDGSASRAFAPIKRRKAERRPGKDHQGSARIGEERFQEMPAGVALRHRSDRQEDDRHGARCQDQL